MCNDITKLSPAKINLYLEVLEKTSDGFHNIESLMTFCDFGDVIRVKKAKSFKFTIDGPFSKKLSLKDNIVLKSISFVEKLLNKNLTVHINLTKNLPISSGMGGGSSNAATVILCLVKMFNIDCKEGFYKSLFSLGADVPFCFFRKSALVTGKGESVLKIENNYQNFFVLLVNPLVEISTKKIFEKITIPTREGSALFSEKFLYKTKIIDFLNSKKNDLEREAIEQCKDIELILDVLKNETNSLLSRMTGSGATCFALFKNTRDLGNAEIIFRNKFKNFWVKKTKIVNSFESL
ncbi:MAG: 4-(cytidine 5'-diphospho)-2-C-methyl-D-erythritol kinase [Rickettsiales bacterium]|nr:4-(cytidine 5'-diphospho)-2-C-methyl-D-erythritol kinase [Rickettsiales bacterium]